MKKFKIGLILIIAFMSTSLLASATELNLKHKVEKKAIVYDFLPAEDAEKKLKEVNLSTVGALNDIKALEIVMKNLSIGSVVDTSKGEFAEIDTNIAEMRKVFDRISGEISEKDPISTAKLEKISAELKALEAKFTIADKSFTIPPFEINLFRVDKNIKEVGTQLVTLADGTQLQALILCGGYMLEDVPDKNGQFNAYCAGFAEVSHSARSSNHHKFKTQSRYLVFPPVPYRDGVDTKVTLVPAKTLKNSVNGTVKSANFDKVYGQGILKIASFKMKPDGSKVGGSHDVHVTVKNIFTVY